MNFDTDDLKRLASSGNGWAQQELIKKSILHDPIMKYDADQARDDHGRFASGSDTKGSLEEHVNLATRISEMRATGAGNANVYEKQPDSKMSGQGVEQAMHGREHALAMLQHGASAQDLRAEGARLGGSAERSISRVADAVGTRDQQAAIGQQRADAEARVAEGVQPNRDRAIDAHAAAMGAGSKYDLEDGAGSHWNNRVGGRDREEAGRQAATSLREAAAAYRAEGQRLHGDGQKAQGLAAISVGNKLDDLATRHADQAERWGKWGRAEGGGFGQSYPRVATQERLTNAGDKALAAVDAYHSKYGA